MKNEVLIIEPVEFVFSERFLRGFESNVDLSGFEVIDDFKKAVYLATAQDLNGDYLVWEDAISNEVSNLGIEAFFDEVDAYLTRFDEQFSAFQSQKSLQHRKNKIKKMNSSFDDFYFSVLGDVYYKLRTVSAQRYIRGYAKNTFLENVFRAFAIGGYPCGIKKDNKIVVYNPRKLVR